MKTQGMRWGLVTFSLGVLSGIVGHYLQPPEIAAVVVFVFSAVFAVFGGLTLDDA